MIQQYLLIVGVFLAYWLYKRYYLSVRFFKDNNIPQPPIIDFFRGNGHQVNDHAETKRNITKYHNLLGETFGITSGASSLLLTTDANLLYKVFKEQSSLHVNRGDTLMPSDLMNDCSLLANENADWARCRGIIGPELTLNKLKREDIQRDLNDAAESVCQYLRRRANPDTVIDAGKLFKTFTLDTVLRATFDQRGQVDYESTDNYALNCLERIVQCIYHPAFVCIQYVPILRPILMLLDRVTTNFRGTVVGVANNALENPAVSSDGPRMKHKLLDAFKAGRLSQAELWGNAAFMAAAGWDTTAQALAALVWLLAAHPEKQTKLRDDIVRDGHQSHYLDWCIRETLRLYPPAFTARQLAHDIEWKGMTMRKGLMVIPSIFELHKKPEYWGDDADVFRPERFAPEEACKHHKAQFFAFGMGPRNCVGAKLAMLEMQMLISRLITEYSIQFCDKSPKFLDIYCPLIFVPVIRDSVILKFVKI
ncbi:Cytochrome P450 3A31 [Fragariocoptes setiger]|uniref:Cytochrome P450 3A31 n=1 Tax=Fragariocoptes setiger TaxID=1670756 RepID=A0ABQ7SB33_9ACAR|nr:Cytochrome P450 3A31 [Fragariocoptes setiger]